MSFNRQDPDKNRFMLTGSFKKHGYDWWWHNFTGISRLTGKEKSFFVEFFVINPGLAEEEPVLGQSLEARMEGKKPSYLCVKAGCWGKDARQLNRYFPLKDVLIDMQAPFCVIADDCYASEDTLKGSVMLTPDDVSAHPEYMSDAGSMSWDLKLDKRTAFNVGYGTSRFLRFIAAFEMYWHAQGMKTLYEGNVSLDGEIYDVIPETSFGYADKNWGKGFTSPWLWLSSNDLSDWETGKRLYNSVFDIGGGRPKVYFIPFHKKLLGAFFYEGKSYEFNFSKPWLCEKTGFSVEETENSVIFRVIQQNKDVVMKTQVRCKKSDMLFINYEEPDGRKRHNHLLNGGNGKGIITLYSRKDKSLIARVKASHVGCEYGEFDADDTKRSLSELVDALSIRYTKRFALLLKRRFGRVWKNYTRSLWKR